MDLSTIQASARDARSAAAWRRDQLRGSVGPAAEQVEHQPSGGGEEQGPGRLLAEESRARMCRWMPCRSRVSQATCSPHKWACRRASGSSTWAATSSSRAAIDSPYVELVGPPMNGQGGVEAVGEQLRCAEPLGPFDRLVGELLRPSRLPGIGPAPGQRRAQPGPSLRHRWSGRARRRAGPGACPARLRRGRPRRRRAPPGSSPPGRPPTGSGPRPRRTGGPRSLLDRPCARRRLGRGDR